MWKYRGLLKKILFVSFFNSVSTFFTHRRQCVVVTFFLTSLSLFLNCLCIWLKHFTWHIIFFTCCMHLLSLQVADEFVKRREETEWWAFLIWESILSENREFCAFKQAMWRYWTARLKDETLLMMIKISNWATLKFNPWYVLGKLFISFSWLSYTSYRFVEGDFDKYVSRMRWPHVWGGEPELFMASHVLQLSFITFYLLQT